MKTNKATNKWKQIYLQSTKLFVLDRVIFYGFICILLKKIECFKNYWNTGQYICFWKTTYLRNNSMGFLYLLLLQPKSSCYYLFPLNCNNLNFVKFEKSVYLTAWNFKNGFHKQKPLNTISIIWKSYSVIPTCLKIGDMRISYEE